MKLLEETLVFLGTIEKSKKAATIVFLTMALLFFVLLIKISHELWKDFLLINPPPLTQPVIGPLRETTANLLAQVSNQHLFGIAKVADKNFSITRLHLKLIGVVATVPAEGPSAIISEDGRPGKIYKIKDYLSAGGQIIAITNQGVILEMNGQKEELPLPRLLLQFQTIPKKLLSAEVK